MLRPGGAGQWLKLCATGHGCANDADEHVTRTGDALAVMLALLTDKAAMRGRLLEQQFIEHKNLLVLTLHLIASVQHPLH